MKRGVKHRLLLMTEAALETHDLQARFLNTLMPGLPVVGFQEHSGPEYEGGDEGEEGHSQNTTGQNYQLHLCKLL